MQRFWLCGSLLLATVSSGFSQGPIYSSSYGVGGGTLTLGNVPALTDGSFIWDLGGFLNANPGSQANPISLISPSLWETISQYPHIISGVTTLQIVSWDSTSHVTPVFPASPNLSNPTFPVWNFPGPGDWIPTYELQPPVTAPPNSPPSFDWQLSYTRRGHLLHVPSLEQVSVGGEQQYLVGEFQFVQRRSHFRSSCVLPIYIYPSSETSSSGVFTTVGVSTDYFFGPVTPVPEPATVSLILVGGGLLLCAARRKSVLR